MLRYLYSPLIVSTSTRASFNTSTVWHLNFALGAVSDGGLQITRVPDPAGVHACTTTYTDSSSGITWNIPFDDFCTSLSQYMMSYFDNSLAWLTNDMVTALEHQHKLFLPAAGVFLMQDAKFNKRGDLLATLHYNG